MSDNPWKNLLEAADRFGRQWADLNRRLDDWNERTKPALERFIEDARKVGDGLSIFPVAFATTLVRGGWSEAPLNGGMPLAEAAELTERLQGKSDDQVRQELDVAIPAYFRKDDYAPLSEMVASWRLHFTDHRESVSEDTLWAHHHQVFEEALWAHKKKRYTLSISALAPQFEGVGQDLMKEYGKKPSGWQDSLNKVLDYEPNQPSKPHEIMPGFMALPIVDRFNKVEETVEELNKHVTPLRIDEFFEKGNPSRAKAVWSVNRHSIAHGNFRNFVEAESLKVFFILDLLHRAVGIYRDREDALLPIGESSDVYRDLVEAAGRSNLHSYFVIEDGNHVDGFYDDYPDRLRPILPCYRAAFEALEETVEANKPAAAWGLPAGSGGRRRR